MRIVRFHMFNVGKADTLHARRLLARYGEGLALDLLDHKEADLLGKGERRAARRARARAAARASARSWSRSGRARTGSPTSRVDGTDLIELGYLPGPELGRTLDDAARRRSSTTRRSTAATTLLARAKALLPS